jgi:pimeloyl-ACP methyl ester carboxylesterase
VKNPRKHGRAPFNTVVIHGGPGARGEMEKVAYELASISGVLEPMQTATSLWGQVEELKAILENDSWFPVTLIGFSWGAWLSFILAASHPVLVKKLILISSGPFEEKYAAQITWMRLQRLNKEEQLEAISILKALNDLASAKGNNELVRLGELFSRADAYSPIEFEPKTIEYNADIFQKVWSEAAELRKSGRLLDLGRSIQCPVTAIQGDFDPHPAKGVQLPLQAVLKSFKFILLKDCGHKPWIERLAKDNFYDILKEEPK